jgi:hypothetical protein
MEIVMKVVKTGMLVLLLVSASISHAASVYKWVDKEGTVHFTDDLSKIPPEYRDQVQTEEVSSPGKPEASPPAPASVPKTEDVKRDALGRGEEYWKETVRPWKKQLKEATEDRENLNQKIDDALEVVKGRYLSKTQYNFKRAELERLMEERVAAEGKIKEAKAALDKIAKEAEDAKADPAWLK